MAFEDEVPTAKRVVRSFMATKGRTRTSGAEELPLETLVELTPAGGLQLAGLKFEERAIADLAMQEISIAEISARLRLPMRATQVLVSELADGGILHAADTVVKADTDLLLRIRSKIQSL